ncbi:MAG: TlpA family protein disulfide reductase [Bacteroidia bacterium]|nr:TlpA family protein disulfide reductase [Bacteroidia bacterium]
MTAKKSFSKILWIPGLIILLLAAYKGISVFTGASTGDAAPDFTAELVNGEMYSLSDSRGHYIILDFWASWCGPCLRDNPKLVALESKYSDKTFDNGSELHVVSVALEKRGEAWKRAAERMGFNWERQIVQKHKIVMASPIANDYGVTDIPAKFLIDPGGNIVSAKTSFEAIDEYLSDRLD